MNTDKALEKRNYRVPEFIIAYGIGRTIFYREVKEGRLKIIKVGNITLVSKEDAEAWLDLHKEATKSKRGA